MDTIDVPFPDESLDAPEDFDPGTTIGFTAEGSAEDPTNDAGPSHDRRGSGTFGFSQNPSAARGASLQLKLLKNQILDQWGQPKDGEDERPVVAPAPAPEEFEGQIIALQTKAREDVSRVWDVAAKNEASVMQLNEMLENVEYEKINMADEKSGLAEQIEDLQERVERTEAHWKGQLQGALEEMAELQQRIEDKEEDDKHQHPMLTPTDKNASENAAAWQKVKNLEEETKTLKSQRTELKKELAEANDALANLQTRLADLEEKEARYDSLKTKHAQVSQKLLQMEKEKASVDEDWKEKMLADEDNQKLIQQLTAENGELKRHLMFSRVDTTMSGELGHGAKGTGLAEELLEANFPDGSEGGAPETSRLPIIEEVKTEVEHFGVLTDPIETEPKAQQTDPVEPPSPPPPVEEPTYIPPPTVLPEEWSAAAEVVQHANGEVHIHLHHHAHSHSHDHSHQHDHVHAYGTGQTVPHPRATNADVRGQLKGKLEWIESKGKAPKEKPLFKPLDELEGAAVTTTMGAASKFKARFQDHGLVDLPDRGNLATQFVDRLDETQGA